MFERLIAGQARGVYPFLARRLLWILQWPYGLAVWLRNRTYDGGWKTVHRVAAPVISVGNMTVGGTGKTPTVEWLARHYREQGWAVTILSRGYGSQTGVNDEALVLEDNLPDVPHLLGADRVALAQIALEELESEILILDDAFQHRRIHRDLDIVLVDATNPWGYNALLPRGLLREPLVGLRRADVVVLSRCDQVSEERLSMLEGQIQQRAPRATLVRSVHQPASLKSGAANLPVDRLKDQPVAAFAGIGNPAAFRHTLVGCGAQLAAFRTYPDHHAYSKQDVAELGRWAADQPPNTWLVTTQKDWVKLRLAELGERPLWTLHIDLQITTNADSLTARLNSLVAGARS